MDLVSFISLFRFSTKTDKIYMTIGTIMAILTGIIKPTYQILFGMIIDAYSNKQFYEKTTTCFYYFLIIGAVALILNWAMLTLWMIAGDRQGIKCRQVYFDALLSQEIAWFDKQNQSELAINFSTQTFAFQEAIGQKVATFISTITFTICGFIISFYKGWQLTLVMLSTLPITTLTFYGYLIMIQQKQKKMNIQYSLANGKVEESLAAIKTVKSLNGENYQTSRFSQILDKIAQKVHAYIVFASLAFGGQFFIILCTHALAVWYGTILINQKKLNWNHTYKAGDVITIIMLIISAGQNLSQLIPCLKSFGQGQIAATRIYSIIDRIPEIKRNPHGKKILNPQGIIQFHNVTFSYPKNPTQLILNNISFKIQPDVTSALVGQSGCGKSTIMQLIMRFYDPNQGKITLDGIDLRQFDLLWLRENIGYVGQQPVLFATTIRQNLLFGKSNATDQQIITALRKAQALDFVENFQNKLQTYVGYGGSQLSGGQKQRLAIARAILKNPKIMLFDEATSSLDRKNQKLIQQNLDRISIGKTTICIAHRIKTIMNSETIFVIQKGNIKEKGKFQELNRFRGIKFEQRQSDVINETDYKISKTMRTLQEQYEEKLQKQTEQNQVKNTENPLWRLIKENQPNCLLFIISSILALLNGCFLPFTSKIISKLLFILSKLQRIPYSVKQNQITIILVIYLSLGVIQFLTCSFQNYIFSILAEKFTTRLRISCFSKMLRMPIPWFDIPKNNSGTLSTRLAIDCKLVNGLVQTLMGLNLQNIGCLISGLIMAFSSDWRVTLVTIALLPLLIFSIIITSKFSEGFSAQTDQAYKDSANLIMQSMINIRTVTSFGVQNSIAKKYTQKLKEPIKLAIKKGNIFGVLYGISQMLTFVLFGLIFWISAILMKNFYITGQNVMNVIYIILLIAWTIGGNAPLMPDIGKCNNSAANLFQILDNQDEDQLQTLSNSNKITKFNKNGAIQIRNVSFKYPNRQVQVFKNLSMKIEAGTKVALVGSSGCGKSTIIQMLMRFYDPTQGEILIDGTPLKQYDIHYLRSLFGVVSQEPVLFNTSIIKNIQYNLQDVTINQIKQAARKANALSFIQTSALELQEKQQNDTIQYSEKGFGRSVGVRGSHISGGQKQRIAIARAIIKNPQILLLDEATSALDANNQKIVQASLDKLMQGLTTITVAHRIDTIKNSNKIYVFENGRIVQSGTYNDLIKLRQVFYNFQKGNLK